MPRTKLKELSFKEVTLLNKFIDLGKDRNATAKALGLTRDTVNEYLGRRNVATELAHRDGAFANYMQRQDELGLITYAEKIEKLTEIVNFNMSKYIDDSGVERMVDPKVAVTGLNSLIKSQGHYVPVEKKLAVEVTDNRSEQEIRESIARLTKEFEELSVIEGEILD